MCNGQGGQVVEIDSEEKWSEIVTYIGNDPALQPALYSGGYWVGATDEAKEGSWLWVTSGRSVSPWAIFHFILTFDDTKDCTVLITSSLEAAVWECGTSKPVICEIGENSWTCRFVD